MRLQLLKTARAVVVYNEHGEEIKAKPVCFAGAYSDSSLNTLFWPHSPYPPDTACQNKRIPLIRSFSYTGAPPHGLMSIAITYQRLGEHRPKITASSCVEICRLPRVIVYTCPALQRVTCCNSCLHARRIENRPKWIVVNRGCARAEASS